jgi:rSAM/selenodomain-associated transferase 2
VRIAIVVPVLNEAASIAGLVRTLADLLNPSDELIVVDGGSTDGTVNKVRRLQHHVPPLRLIEGCKRGRGCQQAAGAASTDADVLWFVHADTIPDTFCAQAIRAALTADPTACGGNFALQFTGRSFGASFLKRTYPWLRLLGLVYGDSAIFVRRDCYVACGGFRDHPIFEDLDLLRRLRGRFVHLEAAVTTSSRRFEDRWFPAVYLHWTLLQVLYWLGVPPRILGRWYAAVR